MHNVNRNNILLSETGIFLEFSNLMFIYKIIVYYLLGQLKNCTICAKIKMLHYFHILQKKQWHVLHKQTIAKECNWHTNPDTPTKGYIQCSKIEYKINFWRYLATPMVFYQTIFISWLRLYFLFCYQIPWYIEVCVSYIIIK